MASLSRFRRGTARRGLGRRRAIAPPNLAGWSWQSLFPSPGGYPSGNGLQRFGRCKGGLRNQLTKSKGCDHLGDSAASSWGSPPLVSLPSASSSFAPLGVRAKDEEAEGKETRNQSVGQMPVTSEAWCESKKPGCSGAAGIDVSGSKKIGPALPFRDGAKSRALPSRLSR